MPKIYGITPKESRPWIVGRRVRPFIRSYPTHTLTVPTVFILLEGPVGSTEGSDPIVAHATER